MTVKKTSSAAAEPIDETIIIGDNDGDIEQGE
jgi:hypothetical protein